jgi:hypothetical protein
VDPASYKILYHALSLYIYRPFLVGFVDSESESGNIRSGEGDCHETQKARVALLPAVRCITLHASHSKDIWEGALLLLPPQNRHLDADHEFGDENNPFATGNSVKHARKAAGEAARTREFYPI